MNDRLLLLGRMLVVFVGASLDVTAQGAECPQAPVPLDENVVMIDENDLAGNGVLVRKLASESGGASTQRHGTTFVATPKGHVGKGLWTTDCDFYLDEINRHDSELCASVNLLRKGDRARIGPAGIDKYKLWVWRPKPEVRRPTSLDDYDPVVPGVVLSAAPPDGRRIDWLQTQVGEATYYVLLGDTRGLAEYTNHKHYIIEIFSDQSPTCRSLRPENVVQPNCADCFFWPGPPKSPRKNNRAALGSGEHKKSTWEADVGGGHEPTRRP